MAGNREVYEQALRQGNSFAWDQKWDQAITAYQRALTEFPGDPVAMDHLGLAFMQSGQLDQAQMVYQEAVRVDPQNPIPHEKIAEILERDGKVVESVQLRLSAAELYLALREADKAIDNWLAAARLVPENMVARSRLALAFERTGQTKQAVTEYLALAAIMQRARQPEKAMQAVEQGMKILPDSPELARARSALKAGKLLAVPQPYKPGMTGMLTPPAGTQPDLSTTASRQAAASESRSASPQDAAQKKAMAILAERLFEADKDTFDQRRASIDQFTSRGEDRSSRKPWNTWTAPSGWASNTPRRRSCSARCSWPTASGIRRSFRCRRRSTIRISRWALITSSAGRSANSTGPIHQRSISSPPCAWPT
jgi:tetratricopeptide (TPR) repeat protein